MGRVPFNPDLAVGGAGPEAPAARSPRHNPLTVTQLTRLVKETLEAALPPTVYVVGEISNFKRHTTGHVYFTLKDENSELACVMWRSAAEKLKFQPADGLDVLVAGEIGVFERTGRYQLYARSIEPRGVGAAELAFRQLCEKLRAEGLFDPRHKKKLPAYPRRIAVVTSPTGAAVQDILNTLKRRFPCAAVVFHPVQVQGPQAAPDVAGAIATVNRVADSLGGIDVLIVGRGGGSIEDLWAFNEEVVARAIYASSIPVISAVGHETDVTVADLVADVRAATPTAAAELAVPQTQDVLDELTFRAEALTRGLRHRWQLSAGRLQAVERRRGLAEPLLLIRDRGRRLADAGDAAAHSLARHVHHGQRRLGELSLVVQRLHPQRFLESRGRRMDEIGHRLRLVLAQRLAGQERLLTGLSERVACLSPRSALERGGDRLAAMAQRLDTGIRHCLHDGQQRCQAQEGRLSALSYRSTLDRGYSITRLKRTGRLVRRTAEVQEGDRLLTELADGTLDSKVVDRRQGELFD